MLSYFRNLFSHVRRGLEGRTHPQAEYAKALLQYKIVVVCQRDDWETHFRLMEAIIGGGMVMTDHVSNLPDGFEDGKSVVVYRSLVDLERKILYYLENDKERKAIAQNGWDTALARHRSWIWLEDFVLGPETQRRRQPGVQHNCSGAGDES